MRLSNKGDEWMKLSHLTVRMAASQQEPVMMVLREPTHFEDMIFYLWTDSNEICTAYVKLKINHILFLKIFDFRFSF